MIRESHVCETRAIRIVDLKVDLVVVGGGMAGVCTSITAARAGIRVLLVQDRPVLGGNASSEVRLWILGATSHMGNNNRWAREGGVINEILIENLYRNREGNTLIFDTILLEKVRAESNLTLLLNTALYHVEKTDCHRIGRIKAFCSQNSTEYVINAPYFCDASGDGIMAFQAGAAFRMGAETKEEFGEKFAPDEAYGELLGHSMYFYSKREHNPVTYIPPDFALKDIEEIPRYKILDKNDHGCRLWWFEYGGRRDTVHETEDIKWELWKVIYGVWDHIKNSGEFEDVDNLTLEWVGTIPGKRESRRFEGHYMLKQQDIIDQAEFDDAVSHGGWAVDLHPADGIYSDLPGCNQWHSKGVYHIPYRCFVSKDIYNLFYAGRIISATHVAFGSTRVMATSAAGGQAVGMAAALCCELDCMPIDLLKKGNMGLLQNRLNITGQSIPGIPIDKSEDLAAKAKLITSSTFKLLELPPDGPWLSLETPTAQMLPLQGGNHHRYTVYVKGSATTSIICELRVSSKVKNYTPDTVLEKHEYQVTEGEQEIELVFDTWIPKTQYAFITFLKNDKVMLRGTNMRYTGILSVFNIQNKAVSNYGRQVPPGDIGIDSFEFWIPKRRPAGHNIAMKIDPPLEIFEATNVINGYTRPYTSINAWVADPQDSKPMLKMEWDSVQSIRKIQIHFDSDFDHPMESSLMGHPESVVPFTVRNFKVSICDDTFIVSENDNHQTIYTIELTAPVETAGLKFYFEHPSEYTPVGVFEICCFS
jgi:hypothetical protein